MVSHSVHFPNICYDSSFQQEILNDVSVASILQVRTFSMLLFIENLILLAPLSQNFMKIDQVIEN